jgi:formylglycine-generating enzyme required for sulfatase activity
MTLAPFSTLLLSGAQKILDLLLASGYEKAKNLTRSDQKQLRQDFEHAWTAAVTGKYEDSLRPLLAHRPFQESIAAGLLDPIEGFNVEAARAVWQDQFPGHERDLKTFFHNLEKILLRDPHWQPLLEVTREAVESGELAARAPDLSMGDVLADVVVIGSSNRVVATGGILIGDQARVFICENVYLPPSGKPELSPAEFDACLQEYLEWVEQANDQARLYGIESMPVSKGKPNKHLGDVFTPLRLRRFAAFDRAELEEIEAQTELSRKKRVYLEKVKNKQEEGSLVALPDLLTTHHRLAIIGGPGCGKSTLLAYLSLALAGRVSTGAQPFKLPSKDSIPVPVLIPLRYYRQYRESCVPDPVHAPDQACAGTLRGFIPWYINRYSNRGFPEDFFDRLLRGGGCLLMLDGLDEVVNQRERGQVREEVERLVHEQYPRNLVIVTAREAGYQKDAVFSDDFLRLDVQPLEDDQIAALCENWCKQLYPLEVAQRTRELVIAIQDINRRTTQRQSDALVRSPLLTAMVISVKYHESELPRERARLYEAVVRVILQAQYLREDGTRDELVRQLGEWDEQLEWLSELALEMQRGGEAGAVISEERLLEILTRILALDQVERFVQSVRLRGGLFEERAEMFQFIHLSFQEFLAARRLAKRREKAYPILQKHLTDPWWREVFLLVYGFAKMDDRETAADYLAWLQTVDGEDEHALAGLELAGAALLDVEKYQPTLVDPAAEKLAARLFDPARKTTPLLRARAGDTLSRLGDPRFDPDCYFLPKEDLLGFIRIPAGEFIIGSDKKIDPEVMDRELPQHKLSLPEYYVARYPVTVAQFTAFVNQSGYKLRDESYLKDLLSRPVCYVTWYDAMAYCDWLDQTLRVSPNLPAELKSKLDQGWKITLPAESEWEKAARGVDGRIYSWGNEYDPNRANIGGTGIGDTSIVGCFPKGTSPYGGLDMIGNMLEWTRSCYKPYPYNPKDGREELQSNNSRVLRGASFYYSRKGARCAFRLDYLPDGRHYGLGFRVAVVSPIFHL